jgi:hypothetical protein
MPFSRTTDGGATWTPPAIIPIVPTPNAVPGGGQIRVLPDGTLVNLFDQLPYRPGMEPTRPTDVWVILSTDLGDQWSDPIHVAHVDANILKDPDKRCSGDTSTKCTTDGDCGLSAPCSAQPIGVGKSFVLSSVAVGADGALYAVWHLIESTSSSRIQFVKSVDGGLTWSAPAPVAVETTQAFLPTLAVSPAGTIGVTYFDFRNDVPGDPALTTDLWFRHSHDGGATWSETHLAGPFDLRSAPLLGGYPLGDYFALAPIGRTGFGAAWIQTIGPQDQDQDNTDAFFARIRVSPRP